jgi:hypothetical protein
VQIKLTPVLRTIKRKDVQPNLGSKLYMGPGGGGGGGVGGGGGGGWWYLGASVLSN